MKGVLWVEEKEAVLGEEKGFESGLGEKDRGVLIGLEEIKGVGLEREDEIVESLDTIVGRREENRENKYKKKSYLFVLFSKIPLQ